MNTASLRHVASNPRTWNYANLVPRAMDSILRFLKHVEFTFFANDEGKIETIQTARKGIVAILTNMEKTARHD